MESTARQVEVVPVLRRADRADAPALADLYVRSFVAATPTIKMAHPAGEILVYFRDMVVPEQETWVALGDASVVGLMALGVHSLDQLYLAPEWRGRGIGDALMTLAKTLRPAGLELWTFQVNMPAQRFYERHGFIEAERTDGSRNEEGAPDICYVWTGDEGG